MSTKKEYRTIADLTAHFGIEKGMSNKEQANDYRRVLKTNHQNKELRLIICRDRIQIILQTYAGKRWRAEAYYASKRGVERGLALLNLPHTTDPPNEPNPSPAICPSTPANEISEKKEVVIND